MTNPALLPLLIILSGVITIAEMINVISYGIHYFTNPLVGQASLQHWSYSEDPKTYYLIAGTLNQAPTAFHFLQDKLLQHNVIMVNYSMKGFDAWKISKWIMDDIEANRRDAIIFTISVGDQVGRWVSNASHGTIPVIAINPCSSPKFLKRWLHYPIFAVAIILFTVCMLLGWLSCVPFIPASGNKYSLQLLADQLFSIALGILPFVMHYHPAGIICSRRDEFLNNDAITAAFPYATVCYIDTKHGDTIGSATKYREGVESLLSSIKTPL